MRTLKKTIVNEIEIKKSRFISIIKNIQSEEEFYAFIEDLKTLYPKATHYCYGYVCGNVEHFSDDGEPGGTAGAPILNVLKKESLNNICCVVIRYFGGIKLGAGGLVRAYTKSVTETLKNAVFEELEIGYKIEIIFPYTEERQINYILNKCTIQEKKFQEQITYIVYVNNEILIKLNNYNVKVLDSLCIKKLPV